MGRECERFQEISRLGALDTEFSGSTDGPSWDVSHELNEKPVSIVVPLCSGHIQVLGGKLDLSSIGTRSRDN